MPPTPTPQVRYHITLDQPGGRKQRVVLDAEDVIAWVRGFATALGQEHHLEAMERAAEDTRRVQALQIGDQQGWFTYLYPEYPDRTES